MWQVSLFNRLLHRLLLHLKWLKWSNYKVALTWNLGSSFKLASLICLLSYFNSNRVLFSSRFLHIFDWFKFKLYYDNQKPNLRTEPNSLNLFFSQAQQSNWFLIGRNLRVYDWDVCSTSTYILCRFSDNPLYSTTFSAKTDQGNVQFLQEVCRF